MEIHIEHSESAQQFFAIIDQQRAELDYSPVNESVLNYYRTFVPPSLRGQNIGEKLVKFALEYAKQHNYKIIPSCPFVERIIARWPEYSDVVYKQ